MANPITFLGAPVNITPIDDGTWRTVDVSAHVPSGASGVLLRSRFSDASSVDQIGFRKTGSTDTYQAAHTATPSYVYTMIGLSASRQLDILVENGGAGACTIELLAYFDPASVVFFDNAALLDTVAQSTWVDLDVTAAVDAVNSSDTAIAAILYLHTTRANATEIGFRKNGSSQDVRASHAASTGGRYIGCVIVPLDAGEIFEGWRASDAYGDFKMVGYVKANFVGVDPAVDVSPGSTGAWTDITQAGALAQMIYAFTASDTQQMGLRKNGDSSTVGYGIVEANTGVSSRLPALVECDGSGVIEGQVDNLAVKLYRGGYFVAAGVGGPSITDVEDESFRVGETGIDVTGTGFGATQDTGFVRVCPSDDIDDVNGVNLTVTTWTDTGITFDVPGTLPLTFPRFTNVYLFVQNDGGLSNAAGYVVQITPHPAVLAYAAGLFG